MADYTVTAPDGQEFDVTAPNGVAQDHVLSTVKQQASKMGMFQSPAASPEKPGFLETVGNTVKEGLAAAEPVRTGGQKMLQSVVPTAIAGGPLGRIAATTGASMVDQAGKGKNPLSWETMIDAAVAGGTEGAGGLAAAGLKKLGAAARGFDWATAAPGQALEAIRSRLPMGGAFINAPSLSAAKMTVQQAIQKLSQTTGSLYRQARQELANELGRLDMQKLTGPKPTAGQVFKDMTSKDRFPASKFSEVAQAANAGARNPAVRAGADAAAQYEPVPGVPAGLFAVPAAAAVGRRLPVVGPWMRAAEDMGNQ